MDMPWPDNYAAEMTADHDRRNLEKIERARAAGQIDANTAQYLTYQYSNSMDWFRAVFHFLGQCFGAPKAPVMPYDYATDSATPQIMRIADINPLSAYLVQHRLDADPMRNQFFTSGTGHRIDLSVSSIVSVIVGAQKRLDRSLEKITGKYYSSYVNDVATTAQNILTSNGRAASGQAIADKIRERFAEKFITNASETVLNIIGGGHPDIAVDMVRALDKIIPPYARLRDVWRVKCLFDLIPQARTFIERICQLMPDRVLMISDKFYDMNNPRNYRDAKLIINIGTPGHVVPMELMCQVRTFFDFERQTHSQYEVARRPGAPVRECVREQDVAANLHDGGIREYNTMVYRCLADLFERVGWNILYNRGLGVALFDGFPPLDRIYYSSDAVDKIMEKLDNAIANEVFHIENAPAPLSQNQESEILHWMTRFILSAAMPYTGALGKIPTDNVAGKLFCFVMNELRRYYRSNRTGA